MFKFSNIHIFALFCVSALLASQVSAGGVLPLALVSRQVIPAPDITPQCQSQCQNLNTIGAPKCTANLACSCNPTLDQGIRNCISCINTTIGDTFLNTYESICAQYHQYNPQAGRALGMNSGNVGSIVMVAFVAVTAYLSLC